MPHAVFHKLFHLIFILFFAVGDASAQSKKLTSAALRQLFQSPPQAAKPWVFWYWMNGAVTKEGITADLQAMSEIGIAGAFLMPIKDTTNPPLLQPTARQLSPQWWTLLHYAMTEAKRLHLNIAMHVSDGFALAGGPWIKPEQSMQKVVWTQTVAEGGRLFKDTLAQPETLEDYYRDIAVIAFPSVEGAGVSTRTVVPAITFSKGDAAASFLATPGNTKNFTSDDSCWIQYSFNQPFTCRSIIIHTRTNYQANRLTIQVSDDGVHFKTSMQLSPPRHGWQDWDADYTHAIPSTTARYFRFVYNRTGSEPGAEDLDAAKWKQSLKISGIELSSEPRINEYESKNGAVWRISEGTTNAQVSDASCVPLSKIIDLTKYLDKHGRLTWQMPAGKWTILRIGHTSTGHRNDTGGGGKGLECDKFDPLAIRFQFDHWFSTIANKLGKDLVPSVLNTFHVDSWECGSQNWSSVFRAEFKKRRGYDLYPYLPVMAGIPVQSVARSEQFLHDVRQTIAELISDNFYGTLAPLAHAKGCTFTAESVAPTMVSDGMIHYKNADIPMGEFWLRSPTHDKPNDMLDAVSGAHVYGKNIVQAEAFTELRMAWDEHPGMLKTLADRNFALGINRFVYHVFTHNPWMDRKPGMTLDPIGLYFQRDQTWWQQAKAWVNYEKRCAVLLQVGRPVVDVAVFTGEEIPRRAVLPDRLVPVLPGIFGEEVVKKEAKRLANIGEPLRQLPAGVTHSANITDPQNWVDPLHGYAYDSYNPDALLHYTTIQKGKLQLAGGAQYKILVVPGSTKMDPNGLQSAVVKTQIQKIIAAGIPVIMADTWKLYSFTTGENNIGAEQVAQRNHTSVANVWKGVYTENSFERFGIERDFIAFSAPNTQSTGIAWTHRTAPTLDIYFVANQDSVQKDITLSLRCTGRQPEIWNPVTGDMMMAKEWHFEKGRTVLPVRLAPNGSLFVVLQQPTKLQRSDAGKNWIESQKTEVIKDAWKVSFDASKGGPQGPVLFPELTDWTKNSDSAIRYYSGTAVYNNSFHWQGEASKNTRVWLNAGVVNNLAEVKVNGISCGIVWTAPYEVEITKAIKTGTNTITIAVVNTWANRLIGDSRLPEEKRFTSTVYPFKMEGKPLLPAGLLGPVTIEVSSQ